jgi:Tol biopolymer transport system component
MSLSAGTMLGPYRVARLVGAGGMGEVYEAVDTRLDRTVAIKVLPAHFASDPERRKRFEREARAVSSLNHPHIATLYDVGDHDGTYFLVMELVQGRTLDAVLHRGKLPTAQALTYATQIAGALDAAHRGGVVHRDLKPGNVMITATGAKLLDFGLAKLDDELQVPDAKAATEQRGPLTGEGTILGTAQYMAPEQLEGRKVDARADIFSLGSILYEMLSGTRAFKADSAAGLTAAILTAEPPPLADTLGPHVAPALEHLVRMCLAKNPDDRWQTAHDVAKQLEWIGGSISSPAMAVPPAKSRGAKVWIAVGAVAATLVAAVVWTGLGRREAPAEPAQLMRFTVSFQDDVRYTIGEDFVRSASISPDGKRIVFTGSDATGVARLFIRAVDSTHAIALSGGEDGTEPFWSPDSKSVGFYAGGKVKIASLDGGRPRELADAPATGGASWNDDGQILISLQNPGPLVLIPAAGGTPQPITVLEPDDIDHDWPQFLDGGDHFLYMSRGRTDAQNKVFLTSLSSPATRTQILEGVPAFSYAAPSHVLYFQMGQLLARRLDVQQRELVGPPVPLAENGRPPFSASRTGALTYRTVSSRPNPLLWLQPDGTLIGEAAPPGFYTDPQISPDGTQLALATRDSANGNFDVAIMDLDSKVTRKLTLNPATERAPVWSPDGKSIVFLSFRPDAPGLYRKNANGVGAEELVLPSNGVVWPYQWMQDRLVIFDGISGSNDVAMLSGDDLQQRTDLVTTPFNDVDGAVSPDGKWLAYTSNETGRWEIYLTTVTPSGTKLPITTEGGCDPVWNRDGTVLYYTRPSTAELMSLAVTPGEPPVFSAPRRINAGPFDYPSAHSIDVDPSGARLIAAPSYSVQGDLTVLVNWQSARPQ